MHVDIVLANTGIDRVLGRQITADTIVIDTV